MPHPSRDLHGPAQSRAVRDLFQSLFIAELIHPSPAARYEESRETAQNQETPCRTMSKI